MSGFVCARAPFRTRLCFPAREPQPRLSLLPSVCCSRVGDPDCSVRPWLARVEWPWGEGLSQEGSGGDNALQVPPKGQAGLPESTPVSVQSPFGVLQSLRGGPVLTPGHAHQLPSHLHFPWFDWLHSTAFFWGGSPSSLTERGKTLSPT